MLPDNILSIHRTRDQKELAELYTAADLFVNPTLEDNFPTVNIESLACGTPVLTYATGGSAEMIDEKTGIVVEKDCYALLLNKLCTYIDNPYLKSEDCILKATEYNQVIIYEKYIDLYMNSFNY